MDKDSQCFYVFPCYSLTNTLIHPHMHSYTHITATRSHHSPTATACTVAMETPASLVILWIGCNEQGLGGEGGQINTAAAGDSKRMHVTQKDTWLLIFFFLLLKPHCELKTSLQSVFFIPNVLWLQPLCVLPVLTVLHVLMFALV